ncbi:hypothetical protein AB9F39_35605, partial [Rhizobium leguminosarum]
RMRHVILPQALPLMLPTFCNNSIELLKGTAVVSLISLTDMTFQAHALGSRKVERDAGFRLFAPDSLDGAAHHFRRIGAEIQPERQHARLQRRKG